MSLKFHPKVGTILLCSFEPGFRKPEMVKKRPVVVVSPKLRNRRGLCTVVPFSTTKPYKVQDYHYNLSLNPVLPSPWNAKDVWVKADMIYTVSFHRLHLIGIGRGKDGRRRYLKQTLPSEDLSKIRKAMQSALGLRHLKIHLD